MDIHDDGGRLLVGFERWDGLRTVAVEEEDIELVKESVDGFLVACQIC